MTENIRSLGYLKHLAELVPGDDACECCKWAVEEIERLRGIERASLLDLARRNPPLAEWYDSPEEECPFSIDSDILNARQAVRDFQADRPGPETGVPPERD